MRYNGCVGRRSIMTARAPNPSMTALGIGALVLVGGALWFGWGTTEVAPSRPDAVLALADADTEITVHVSGAVLDPGVVQVPSGSRVMDVVLAAGGATRVADLTQINLASSVRDGERVIVPRRGVGQAPSGGLAGVDINTATAQGLEDLPGVGPVLAARIVAHRDEHGLFSEVEDLLDVVGIGESKLAAMRDAVSSP